MALVLAVAELPPVPRSAGAMLFFVVASTVLCFAEVVRRRERVLIGNLGMSGWSLAAISALPASCAELCFVAGARLIP